MQTTQQALQKLKGTKLVLCRSCGRNVPMTDFTDRQVENGLIEIGLECSNCGEWYHSFFLNDDLQENKPQPEDDRDSRREYQKRFQKFQRKMRKRFDMQKINGVWIGSPAS